ncbi:MAG: hypothetical protein V4663_09575 [Bacteroidota bacterium]
MNTDLALHDFIAATELGAFPGFYPSFKGAEMESVSGEIEQSFLNAKSLVSFASGINGQNKQDVLDSTLFAQLAANKKFPGDDQIISWYTYFIEVMNKIGWVIEGAEFSRFNSSHALFEIENVIIDILTSALGGNYVTIISKTLGALKELGSKDGKIKAFEKNTHSLKKGAFQIGLATEENGLAALTLGTFLISTNTEIKTILFFKSSQDSVDMQYCSRKGTLNPSVYDKIRETISAKIIEQSNIYVTEIEI